MSEWKRKKNGLMEECVGEDIGVQFFCVADFVAAAAAATFRVGAIVEAFRRVDYDDFLFEGKAFQGGGTRGL